MKVCNGDKIMGAELISKYFLWKSSNEEDTGISNLKLQKLLYYSQGFHLAIFGERLFDDEIYAWQHGPVCPDIYHLYKVNVSNVIPYTDSVNFEDYLSDEQIEFLDEVYDEFGQFSAWRLRNMTHDESTWINHEHDASIIPQDELKEYFLTRV
jgi:uncharacterized phage-associated protein